MTILIAMGWAGFFVLGYTLGNIQGYKYGRERGIEEEQIRHIREEI